jgi:hypothetical protein
LDKNDGEQGSVSVIIRETLQNDKFYEFEMYSGMIQIEQIEESTDETPQIEEEETVFEDTHFDIEEIEDGIYQFKYINSTNVFQSTAVVDHEIGSITGSVNKEQIEVLQMAEYSNSSCVFEGAAVESTSLSYTSSPARIY